MSTAADVTAPDPTPTDLPADGQGAADTAVAAPGEEGGESAPVVDADQAALDAFNEGVATTIAEPKTAADVIANTAEGAAAPAAAPSPAAAPAAAPAPAATAPPETDPDMEREVKELGLKGRTEERFREMSSQLKEVAPLREALTKYQITDPARIEQVIESAQRAQEWEDTVLASTATPEQFGSALNVIKAMNSDDPKMQNAAFEAMLGEVVNLGRRLGREVPGLVDPLQSHADLLQEVAAGDLTRARALEVAAQRAMSTANEAREVSRGQQSQHQAAMSRAIADLETLNGQLKASDPDFGRKLVLLQPTLDVIRESVHPSQWVDRIQRAYNSIPVLPPVAAAPAPAPAPRVPVSHMPVRPTGGNLAMRQKPKDDRDAFEMGLRSLQAE